MILSSSSVHEVFLISGLRWLCQRSRHCLPMRPFRCLAINVHRFGPYFRTNSMTCSSSSLVQGPVILEQSLEIWNNWDITNYQSKWAMSTHLCWCYPKYIILSVTYSFEPFNFHGNYHCVNGRKCSFTLRENFLTDIPNANISFRFK